MKPTTLITLLLLLFTSPLYAAPVMVNPSFHLQDDDGELCSGCTINTYVPGTSTPKDTYTNATLATPQTNPIVLDSRGEPTTSPIYMDGLYKIVIKDADGNTIDTQDNVRGIGSYASGHDLLSNYSSLSAAVTSISTTETTLVIDQDDTMTGNVTVPSTLTLEGRVGNLITTTGYTLTINGPFEAGPFQVFAGTGTLDLTSVPNPINIKWAGATGDGSTDDYAAVQRIYTGLSGTTGSTVIGPMDEIFLVGGATYLLVPSYVTTRGIHFKCKSGATFTRLITNWNTTTDDDYEINFYDCKFDGNGEDSIRGIGFYRAHKWVVDGCYFEDWVNGVRSEAPTSFTYVDAETWGNSPNAPSQFRVTNNRLYNTGDYALVFEEGSNDGVVSGNILTDCERGILLGIWTGRITCANNTINGGTAPQANDPGIGITQGSHNHTITGNTITGRYSLLMHIEAGFNHVVSGNYLEGASQGSTPGTGTGIKVYSSTVSSELINNEDVKLIGNVIRNANNGITVSASGPDATNGAVENVSVIGNTVDGCTGSGITVANADETAIVANNTVYVPDNDETYGITVSSVSGSGTCNVTGNVVWGPTSGANDTRGIRLNENFDGTVTGNAVWGCKYSYSWGNGGTGVDSLVFRNNIGRNPITLPLATNGTNVVEGERHEFWIGTVTADKEIAAWHTEGPAWVLDVGVINGDQDLVQSDANYISFKAWDRGDEDDETNTIIAEDTKTTGGMDIDEMEYTSLTSAGQTISQEYLAAGDVVRFDADETGTVTTCENMLGIIEYVEF